MTSLTLRLVFLFSLCYATKLSACGYFILGEDYRIALLNPYLIGEDYSAFFYSADNLNHGSAAQAGTDRLRNAAAWAKELNQKTGKVTVTEDDVMAILYGTTLAGWLDAKEGGAANLGWATNPAWLAIRERPDLLEYMLYAKGYESPAEIVYEWWNEPEEKEVDPAQAPYKTNFQERALAGYNKAKKRSFLKERYAYQLLLLAYYAQDEAAMETYFFRHFKDKQGPLADWARFHFAELWNEEGRTLVEYANAFRAVPEKAIAIYRRTPRQLDPKQYLSATRTDTERSNLYALAALKQKGKALGNLREAYRLDPTNPIVELLLVREFNKLEDWLMTHELTGLGPALPAYDWPEWGQDYEARKQKARQQNYTKDRAYLKQFREFVQAYQQGNEADDFAQLLRAQAALLDEDYAAVLQLTATLPPANGDVGRQVKITQFLAQLQAGQLEAPATRQVIAEQLLELDRMLGKDRDPEVYYDPKKHKLQPTLSRVTAKAFAQSGDTLTAFFLHNRSLELALGDWYRSDYYDRIEYLDRPISPEVINHIIAVVERQDTATLFNRLLLSGKLPEKEALYDLAGTLALRRNDLAGALQHFAQVPLTWYAEHEYFQRFHYNYYNDGQQKVTLWSNPFAPIVGYSIGLPTIPKAEIVRRMIALEATASQGGEEGANACLILGEAWYNMSDLGNSWDLLSYGQSSGKPSGPIAWPNGYQHAAVPHTQHDYDLIFKASRAVEYLDCAAASATDPTLKAEIDLNQRALQYLLLERATYADNYGWLQEEERIDLNKAYQRIMSPFVRKYGNTDFYERKAAQCSWLAEVE